MKRIMYKTAVLLGLRGFCHSFHRCDFGANLAVLGGTFASNWGAIGVQIALKTLQNILHNRANYNTTGNNMQVLIKAKNPEGCNSLPTLIQ